VKTGQLIDLLARQSGVAPRWVVEARLGVALAIGLVASAALAVGLLGLNPALAEMGPALGTKLAYVICLLLGAMWLSDRSARPGAAWRRPVAGLIVVVVSMGALALSATMPLSASMRLDFLIGRSWASCPWHVAALSIPAFAAALWAMRGLAPTRPRLAGFAAGLLAGSLGATGYALHCPELSPLFVLVWYSLGILVPAVAGAALGPRLFRW
jgi:hypothetical protein